MNELIATIPCIIVICYLIGVGAKAIPSISDNLIPVIVGICGGILGVVGMYTIKDFPAKDILNALAIGIASGLASTGANQIVKQLKQGTGEEGYFVDHSDDIYWDDDDDQENDSDAGR